MAAIDLNQAIQSTLMIARNEYKYVADLETDLGDAAAGRLPRRRRQPGVLNIVVNAAHAIGDVVSGPTSARARSASRPGTKATAS